MPQDKKGQVAFLGGYSAPCKRDNLINDNFHAFVVQASSNYFKEDQKEIQTAMWVDWKALLHKWRAAGEVCRTPASRAMM